jgi:hypothetical protein
MHEQAKHDGLNGRDLSRRSGLGPVPNRPNDGVGRYGLNFQREPTVDAFSFHGIGRAPRA